MTEIFISYSRRDKAFVDKFLNALHDNGYSSDLVWVDWEDIPSSAKWEEEIKKGIERTNSVIFVLSPEWVISNECKKELKVAAEYNKRLFPIVWQDVKAETIPAELASLNWIFFRETDDFEQAFQKLLDALKTDLNWVSQHTNLLRQANEWRAKGQDSGYLLRGSELQEAEAWLRQATEDKQPRPTQLQSEYIIASRQDDIQRQRNRMIWVSTGLVVSILLAIAAAYFGLQAQRESQSALAFQLAAQSSNLGATQPDLSLLLSLQASYIGDELGGPESSWLVGGFVTSLNSSPHLKAYLRDNENAIRAVTFSPDGKWLAAAGQPELSKPVQVTLWDMTSVDNLQPAIQFTGPENRILALVFGPDGKYLYGAGDDAKIFVWDLRQCCDPVEVWDLGDNNKARALTVITVADRQYIAAGAQDSITFWDLQNGERKDAITLQRENSGRILSLAASPREPLLAAGSEDGNVTVWDMVDHSLKYEPLCSVQDESLDAEVLCHKSGSGQTDIRGLAFSADGKWLAAGSSDQHAWLWDVETGTLLARSPDRILGGHINTVSSVAFDPTDQTGRGLATASWDNTVRFWQITGSGSDLKFELVDALIGHSSSVWTLAYSPTGKKWLASGSSDHTTILWDPDQVSQIGTLVDQMTRDVWALAVSPEHNQLAAGDDAGNIHLWDIQANNLKNRKELKQDGAILSLAYNRDGKWLVSAGTDKSIHVWDAKSGQEAWSIPNAHEDEIWSAIFSPDDRWLASASFDKTVKLWDAATRQMIGEPIAFNDQVYALAFKADGTELLVAGYDSNIRRIDLSQPGAPRLLDATFEGHLAAVNSLAFNPLYPQILASTSDDKTLLIWNTELESGNHTEPVLGLNESMEAVTFRPDGKWLASATDNKTVLLWQWDLGCAQQWDPARCQPAILGSPLLGHRAPVENLVFLSNTSLVSSSADGQLILWNLDKSFWYQHACDVVNRGLQEAEISQYTEGKLNETLLKAVAGIVNFFNPGKVEQPPSCLRQDQS